MDNFAFFLKTYSVDYDRTVRLIDTYRKYNAELILLYIACPKTDIYLFKNLEGADVHVIPEEDICEEVFVKDSIWSAGYLNQEIYKLSFWETGLCANYMCIDSDAVFIRPFYKKDFMYDDETPYTALKEDNDLRADIYYNRLYWNGRMDWIEKIGNELDYHPYHLLTCHGFQIFSGRVLESLRNDFMRPHGYSYKNLIEIAPYEFTWYSMWLQKTEIIPIHIIEPLFKCFHLKQHHIISVMQGMKIEDWAKGYVGIIVNSNYGVGNGDYYDLSVYNSGNADIPNDVIDMNYHFYKRLRKGRLRRNMSLLMLKIRNKIWGAESDE
ncbi:MAG: DUF6492 family protein [Butyrivibrio sp.]|nr:DUF6492 family protein [Butyrivibrio sp.]